MNKNLRGILQLCAFIDVAILGMVSGLLVFWFDDDNNDASSTLGFISTFSYFALFLHVIPSLLVANQMQKKKTLFVPILYVLAVAIVSLLQGVLIFLTWFFAGSSLSQFSSKFDSASIVFVIITGISILTKIINIIAFLYAINSDSGGENDADSEEFETVALVKVVQAEGSAGSGEY